jgi:hypothetical protein
MAAYSLGIVRLESRFIQQLFFRVSILFYKVIAADVIDRYI